MNTITALWVDRKYYKNESTHGSDMLNLSAVLAIQAKFATFTRDNQPDIFFFFCNKQSGNKEPTWTISSHSTESSKRPTMGTQRESTVGTAVCQSRRRRSDTRGSPSTSDSVASLRDAANQHRPFRFVFAPHHRQLHHLVPPTLAVASLPPSLVVFSYCIYCGPFFFFFFRSKMLFCW